MVTPCLATTQGPNEVSRESGSLNSDKLLLFWKSRAHIVQTVIISVEKWISEICACNYLENCSWREHLYMVQLGLLSHSPNSITSADQLAVDSGSKIAMFLHLIMWPLWAGLISYECWQGWIRVEFFLLKCNWWFLMLLISYDLSAKIGIHKSV